MGSCLKFIHDIAVFIAPVLLKAIIHFASSADAPVWRGVFFSVCLLLVAFMQTLLLSTYFYRMYLVGLWVKSALISAIYRKSLTVTAEAKKGSTSGEIVNLMSVDAQKITDMLPYLNMLWSSPLQITVAIYMLYQVSNAPNEFPDQIFTPDPGPKCDSWACCDDCSHSCQWNLRGGHQKTPGVYPMFLMNWCSLL